MPRSTEAPDAGAVVRPEGQGLALDGNDFRRLLRSGTAWLERNAAAVDALNVFPVPDGDTGTNMLLTMRAALEGALKPKGGGAAQVMKAASQGAVMGARGNSGVILSQIIAGIARGLGERTTCDGQSLAGALAEGAATAYRAVSRPVEGTILTVARAAGEGAVAAAGQVAAGAETSCLNVLDRAVAAAQDAVRRTPEQLPILRQAGVVDAGGEGYRVILEGMALALAGRDLPEMPAASTPTAPDAARPPAAVGDAAPVPGEEWGYCTQFVIQGNRLDVLALRRELQEIAESALVVGDESLVRVHGHTEDPGQLLSYAVRHGRLERVSIEDMDAQHDAWLRSQVEARAPDPGTEVFTAAPGAAMAQATVAVAPGAGLAAVFRSLGVGEVVPGGQTMNPSTNDILEAAGRTGASSVLVLPNNSRILLAAQQAAAVAAERGQQLLVVPTRTIPQGVAAQLAFDLAATPEANAGAMAEAAARVRTVEVTRATRSVTINEIAVVEGDYLALLDDVVVHAAADPLTSAMAALDQAGAERAEIITVYRGESPGEAEAQAYVRALRQRYPSAEIELVYGGQPHYDYSISVE